MTIDVITSGVMYVRGLVKHIPLTEYTSVLLDLMLGAFIEVIASISYFCCISLVESRLNFNKIYI